MANVDHIYIILPGKDNKTKTMGLMNWLDQEERESKEIHEEVKRQLTSYEKLIETYREIKGEINVSGQIKKYERLIDTYKSALVRTQEMIDFVEEQRQVVRKMQEA